MRSRATRPSTFVSAALAATLLLGAACGSNTPLTGVPAQSPTTILTATPYPKPPQPIIVDPSGAIAGNQPNFREVPYRVEAGDTLIAIAARFDTTVEAIVKRNSLANASDLKIGQDLIVPTNSTVVATVVATTAPATTATATAAARTPTPAAASTPTSTSTPAAAAPTATPAAPSGTGTPAPGTTTTVGGVRTYIVERGDTASGIADQFNVTTEELAKANNRTVASLTNLQVGDRLVIPPAR